MKTQPGWKALIVFKHPNDPPSEERILIDTEKHLILSIEHLNGGKRTSMTQFGDFVEMAGHWYAESMVTLDDKERKIAITTQKIFQLSGPTDDVIGFQIRSELADRDKVQFVHEPAISLGDAKAGVGGRQGDVRRSDRPHDALRRQPAMGPE